MDKRIKRQGGQVVSRLLAALLPTKQQIKIGMKEIVTSGEIFALTHIPNILPFFKISVVFVVGFLCIFNFQLSILNSSYMENAFSTNFISRISSGSEDFQMI